MDNNNQENNNMILIPKQIELKSVIFKNITSKDLISIIKISFIPMIITIIILVLIYKDLMISIGVSLLEFMFVTLLHVKNDETKLSIIDTIKKAIRFKRSVKTYSFKANF